MKTTILAFIHTLGLYDYLLFGGILFFFLLFLILAILVRHKLALAISFVVFGFLMLVTAPIQYMLLHKYLYKHTLTLTTVQDLSFSEALLIRGDINNTSSMPLKECTLYIGISQTSPIKILNKLYPYTPFRIQKLKLEETILPHESKDFKLLVEPFSYPKRFQVTARGVCK